MSDDPIIVSHGTFLATIPIETVARVINTWRRTLQNEAEDIYAKILARIPDVKRFVERLATTSHEAYRSFVNPDFKSKSGLGADRILASHAANISRSYGKYAKKLSFLFETVDGVPAKRFKDLVEAMKDEFGTGIAERTLPFTGTRIEGYSCATIATYWLVGDKKILGMLRPADKVPVGGPFLITTWEKVPTLKSALMHRLVQAGANILKSNYDPATITEENTRINEIVQGMVDPALGLKPFAPGGESHVDYILDGEKRLWLDVQVSTG